MINTGHPIDTTYQKHKNIAVNDYAGIIGNKYSVKEALEYFYDKTGIVVNIETVLYRTDDYGEAEYDYYYHGYLNENTYIGYLDDLKEIAFNEYYDKFGDEENQWMIVIASSRYGTWNFEGVQGDNTDYILTPSRTSNFNSELVDKMAENPIDITIPLIESFYNLSESINLNKATLNENWYTMIFSMLFIIFHCYFMVFFKNKSYKGYVLDEDYNTNTVKEYAKDKKHGVIDANIKYQDNRYDGLSDQEKMDKIKSRLTEKYSVSSDEKKDESKIDSSNFDTSSSFGTSDLLTSYDSILGTSYFEESSKDESKGDKVCTFCGKHYDKLTSDSKCPNCGFMIYEYGSNLDKLLNN